MNYGICSVPWLVQCIRRVLHVVTMMICTLAYCELLLLYLVGVVVCGCNQNIHRYVCMPIGGDGLLIAELDLGLLLLAGALCPTF